MTTYKELFGKAVKYLSTDPTTEAEGQVWYNSTSGTFKSVVAGAAWSSGASMIRTASGQFSCATGTQTAALVAGGYSPYTNLTEEYNGSGWSTGGNLGTTRIASGFGTQTAALAAGGLTPPNTATGVSEEYDGSTWTAGGSLNTARAYSAGSGTLTAGVSFGGLIGPPFSVSNATEEYNGTSFTSANNMNYYKRHMGVSGRGPQTATLGFGGGGGPSPASPGDAATATTESYDGTSWTSVNSMNTARFALGSAGIQTSALAFGGYNGTANVAVTESWDGTNWSTSPATLATARNTPTSIGTSSSALYAGGQAPVLSTEEYNFSGSIITGAAWASGGTYPTGTFSVKMVGDKNAAVGFAGYNAVTTTNEYDGTSWSPSPSIPNGGFGLGFSGTQTAALAWGGYSGTFGGGAFNPTTANEYNGSTWASAGSTPFQGRDGTGFGTQTATIGAGGYSWPAPAQPPTGVGVRTSNTISYDGTSWTNVNAMNTAIELLGGAGTQTAGLAFGGQNPPSLNLTEEWDGTNWTSGGTLNDGRRNLGGFGTQTAGYAVGGRNPGALGSSSTELYDGTAWVTQVRLATGRSSIAVASNIAGPGQEGNTNTEEFTGETSTLNYKTITTS